MVNSVNLDHNFITFSDVSSTLFAHTCLSECYKCLAYRINFSANILKYFFPDHRLWNFMQIVRIDKLAVFFFFFPENMIWQFMQIITRSKHIFWEKTICLKCEILFSGKKIFFPRKEALILHAKHFHWWHFFMKCQILLLGKEETIYTKCQNLFSGKNKKFLLTWHLLN